MDINNILKDKNLKVTPQRVAILHEVFTHGHISVDDIYAHIKNRFPSISLATVYKNINALKDLGIVYEINTQDAKPKYEIRKQAHAHFICQVCHSVEDVDIKESEFKKYGQFNQIDLYLYGVCEHCKKANAQDMTEAKIA